MWLQSTFGLEKSKFYCLQDWRGFEAPQLSVRKLRFLKVNLSPRAAEAQRFFKETEGFKRANWRKFKPNRVQILFTSTCRSIGSSRFNSVIFQSLKERFCQKFSLTGEKTKPVRSFFKCYFLIFSEIQFRNILKTQNLTMSTWC